MKLGMTLTNLGPLATPDNIVNFAQAAENLGFASLWVTERLLLPVQPRQPYAGGAWPDVYKQVLDPLDALVFAAAITQKIRLGTSVLDFPFLHPGAPGQAHCHAGRAFQRPGGDRRRGRLVGGRIPRQQRAL